MIKQSQFIQNIKSEKYQQIIRWLKYKLLNQIIAPFFNNSLAYKKNNSTYYFMVKDVHNDFYTFCSNNQVEIEVNSTKKLNKKLLLQVPGMAETCHMRRIRCYIFDLPKLKHYLIYQ